MRGCSCYIYSLYTVSFLTPARILPRCFFLIQAADGYIPLVYPYEDTRHRIQQLAICILKIYFLLSCVYGFPSMYWQLGRLQFPLALFNINTTTWLKGVSPICLKIFIYCPLKRLTQIYQQTAHFC